MKPRDYWHVYRALVIYQRETSFRFRQQSRQYIPIFSTRPHCKYKYYVSGHYNIVLLIFQNTLQRLDCLRLQIKPTPLGPIDRVNASETGFCLRLQVKPIQLGPDDRASVSETLQRLDCLRLQVKSTPLGPIDRASVSETLRRLDSASVFR
jgi:hypothetical protein